MPKGQDGDLVLLANFSLKGAVSVTELMQSNLDERPNTERNTPNAKKKEKENGTKRQLVTVAGLKEWAKSSSFTSALSDVPPVNYWLIPFI